MYIVLGLQEGEAVELGCIGDDGGVLKYY